MSILRRVAANVTAADLQQPLGPFLLLDETVIEAERKTAAAEPVNMPYRRRTDAFPDTVCLAGPSEGCPTHYLWQPDLCGGAPEDKVASVATRLEVANCVAGDTPALTLATLLSRDKGWPWRLVLNHDRATGFVSHLDMARLPFSIAVLALLLDVEQVCLDVCSWEPGDAEAAWDLLAPQRQAKAREVYGLRVTSRLREPDYENLIECTTFMDKATMVSSLPSLSDMSRRSLTTQFRLMEKVRNALAHSSCCSLEELLKAINVAEEILRRLAPAAERPPIRLVVSNDPPLRGPANADGDGL